MRGWMLRDPCRGGRELRELGRVLRVLYGRGWVLKEMYEQLCSFMNLSVDNTHMCVLDYDSHTCTHVSRETSVSVRERVREITYRKGCERHDSRCITYKHNHGSTHKTHDTKCQQD